MSFLAIRKSPLEGVYSFGTKEEASAMQAVTKGCSCRFFNDDEQEAALKWANVTSISDSSALINAASTVNTAPEPAKYPSYSSLLSAAVSQKRPLKEDASPTVSATETPISTSNPAPVPKVEAKPRYICTGCGAEFEEFAKFCVECGSPLKEVLPEPPVVSPINVPVPDPTLSEPISIEWTCSAGHSNPMSAAFCMECGEKKPVAAAEVPQPAASPVSAPVSIEPAPVVEEKKEELVFKPAPTQVSEPDVQLSEQPEPEPLVSLAKEGELPKEVEQKKGTDNSLTKYDYERITSAAITGGYLKDVLGSYKALGVPLIKLVLSSGQDVYIALSNLYYAAADVISTCYSVAKDDPSVKIPNRAAIKSHLKNNEIVKIPKAWIFPRKECLMSDRIILNSYDAFWSVPSLHCIMSNNIIRIEGINTDKLISNDNLPFPDAPIAAHRTKVSQSPLMALIVDPQLINEIQSIE